MIRSLYIKDFALIDQLEIEFEAGLNIMTGQTGAGKSIIIGALNMILGERADTDVIRSQARKAVVEASLQAGDDPAVKQLLDQEEIEFSPEIIIRREIRNSGSRAFVNDTPVTLPVLKNLGNYLVDLHGQHDHQLLLKPEHHREMVDGFESIQPKLEAYRHAYEEMRRLARKWEELSSRKKELQEQMELYQFQLEELNNIDLDPETWNEREREMQKLDNAEELKQAAQQILNYGSEGEVNAVDMLQTIQGYVNEMSEMDGEFESYIEELNSAVISLQEMIQFTETYRDSVEFNPQRLEQLRQKKSELNRLQKKYNRTIEELAEYKERISREVDAAENVDYELEQLENKIEEQRGVLQQRAEELHLSRNEQGQNISNQVEKELHKLGMPHAQMKLGVEWLYANKGWLTVDGSPVESNYNGADHVEFYISSNKGEDLKPLAKVASGGEISRIMLGLKSVLAREQHLPVMIFDEIDAGISGQISEKVGRTMRALANQCQIICITHQPQIACYAHYHYQVEKIEEGERTVTRINKLDQNSHIEEIATLMSGESVTQASLDNARQMVDRAAEI